MPSAVKTGLIVLAAGVYAIVFAEFFLRLMAPQPMLPRFITGTDMGIRGNIPNAAYRQSTPEVDVVIRINGQGMRGERDFALEKPPATCRIALMGDSYFMGYEVDFKDSFAARLRERFRAAGYRTEVLNFAVSGFGTAEMLVQFEREAARYGPDFAIFQLHAGDFAENVRADLYRLEDGAAVRTGKDFLPAVELRDRLMQFGLYRWLIQSSHLYTAAREKAALFVKDLLLALRTGKLPGGEGVNAAKAAADQLRAAAPLTAALLRQSRAAAEKIDAAWHVFEVPTWSARTTFSSNADLFAETPAIADRLTTPLSALQMAAAPDVKLYFEKGHRHFTPRGNDIAAGVMVDAIRAKDGARLEACKTG